MENHPIPQDVTGFKFKLIGSVTIKQFLYLIGGGILAAICFILPVPGIIKYPLSFLFGGLGAALAFVPIEGRPMDIMIKNFLKALPSENQYIFKKRGAEALIAEFFSPQLAVSIKAAQQKVQESTNLDTKRALLFKTLRHSYQPDEKEQAILKNINGFLNESAHSASPSVQNIDAQPTSAHSPLAQIATPAASPKHSIDPVVAVKVAQPPKETPNAKPAPPIQAIEQVQPEPKPQPSTTEMQQAQSPVPIQTPLATTPFVSTPTPASPEASNAAAIVTPESNLKAGFPELPDTPNIVMGIIKDPRGKIIPNILVEIMDTQGIPVRAFKTNALGQFAAATPLPNGEYNVILEDPRKQNEFGEIRITLDGQIFQPIVIVSIDQREKLRRELFGGPSAPQAAA